MKRPLSITIIGTLVIMWGLWTSCRIVKELFISERLSFYVFGLVFTVFSLLWVYVGIELLRLKDPARKAVIVLLGLSGVRSLFMLLASFFNSEPVTIFIYTTPAGPERIEGVGLSLLIFSLLSWAFLTLIRPSIRELFKVDIMPFRNMTAEEFLELRTLATLSTLAEADALCAHLGGDGIKTFIPDQNYVTGRESAIGGIRVQVKAQDLPRAKSLMAEWENNA